VRAGAALIIVERGRGAGVVGVIDEGGNAEVHMARRLTDEGGNAAVLLARLPCVVEVDDTLTAWGALARAHLSQRRPRIVAITGSAGKTTTKELVAALLSEIAPTHKTAGNLNNRIGVPAVCFGVDEAHAYLVLEAGMSVPGEIASIAAIARLDVAVVTNVGLAHAGGVGGSREDVAREKGALIAGLAPGGVAVTNADESDVAFPRAERVVTFGRSPSAHYRLAHREPLGARGAMLGIVRSSAPPLDLRLPLVGEVAAIDLCAALAAAEAATNAPIPQEKAQIAMDRLALPEGRGALHQMANGAILLDDTYNANPASMRAALLALAEIAAPDRRRLVCVLGEMRELGAAAVREHELLGDALAPAGVALAIGCGGLVDLALDHAARAGVATKKARSTEEAGEIAVREVGAGDAVLVKGSRGVATERVVRALMGRGA
jgi:UDP-N-acetylmuramoyl-tripeptide--D-alanyl-D-alanine ligase